MSITQFIGAVFVLVAMLYICSARTNLVRLGLTAPVGGAEAFYRGEKNLDGDALQDLALFATHLSMDLILEQLWGLCETGFRMRIRLHRGGDLVTVIVVPYVIRFVADLVEHFTSLSIPAMCHIKLRLNRPIDLGEVNVRAAAAELFENTDSETDSIEMPELITDSDSETDSLEMPELITDSDSD